MLGRASYSSIYTTVLPPDNISDIDRIDRGVGVDNGSGIRGFAVGVGSWYTVCQMIWFDLINGY
jgi:hypothetical protein